MEATIRRCEPRFRMRRTSACTLGISLVWVLSAQAADPDPTHDAKVRQQEDELIENLDLQTLLNTPVDVWTPSKAAQTRYEAPAIITTVTREQIEVWGHRSLAEVLGHLLGFYVVDDHSTPNLAVRGTSGGLYSDSSIVKVLINGHAVSFSSTGGNWLGPELIPLTAIERIEVIRGPASSLYGADAFLGMINIKTRSGADLGGAHAAVAASRVGKHFGNDVDVSVGTGGGAIEALVAYRQTDDDLSGLELPATSPQPNVPRYNRGATAAAGLDQHTTSAVATVTARPNDGRTFSLFAHYASFNRGGEFGSLLHLAHGHNEDNAFSENRVSQWQARAGGSYSEQLSDCLKLSLQGAYFHGRTRDNNRLEVGSEYYYVRRRMRFAGGDFDAHVEWSPVPSFVLSGGSNLIVDRERLPARIAVAKRSLEGAGPGEVIPRASVYQGRKIFFNAAAYLQATYQTFDGRLGLTAGLRYDRHNVYGGQLSRRIGLVGQPFEKLHAKLLHGTAFQAPSPFLLYAVPASAGDVLGNRSLRPQFVNTFELQLEWEGWAPLTLSTDLAYSLIDDRTEFIQQGINKVARNVLETGTVSWENKAELQVQGWLNAYASFELQRTVLRTGQEGYAGQLIGSQGNIYPRAMVHAGLAAMPEAWPLRAAVLASYIGERRSSGNNTIRHGGTYSLEPYVLLEANLATRGFRVLRHPEQELWFSFSAKNLLGATGPSPGFAGVDYPLSPRAFYLQANFRL